MRTTEKTTRIIRATLRPMLHFRHREKLGLGSDTVPISILSPAAALDDAQSQEQEKQRQTHQQNHRSCIDNSPRKIVHLIEEGERRQNLRLPGVLGWKLAGEKSHQEEGRSENKTDHGRRGLTACNS